MVNERTRNALDTVANHLLAAGLHKEVIEALIVEVVHAVVAETYETMGKLAETGVVAVADEEDFTTELRGRILETLPDDEKPPF